MILAIICRIGASGGAGHVIEYRGDTFDAMSIAARLTVANMSIKAGARSELFALDATTFAYLEGRPMAPHVAEWCASSNMGRPCRATRARPTTAACA